MSFVYGISTTWLLPKFRISFDDTTSVTNIAVFASVFIDMLPSVYQEISCLLLKLLMFWTGAN